MRYIITVGREFGSGGSEIASRLAETLGVPFYDKELITLVAEQSDLAESFLRETEETPPSHFLRTSYWVYQMPMSDQIFLVQSKTIKELAAKGPCVIVGRCADYVLKELETVDIFIYGAMRDRIVRKQHMDTGIAPDKMEAHIRSIDKKRAKYYATYTGNTWGMAKNYDLCLNSSKLGIEGSVEMIRQYLGKIK